MKDKNFIIFLVIAIASLVAINFKEIQAYTKRKIGYKVDENSDFSNQSLSLDKNKILEMGSSGKEVRQLQEWLIRDNLNGLPIYGADGIFGEETETALLVTTGRIQITLKAYENGSWVQANSGIAGNYYNPDEVAEV